MRITVDEWAMEMAHVTAKRGTCARRKVGCILLDERNDIKSTGYNGTPRKMEHCNPSLCPAHSAASGTQLDGCFAVHAEQNALLQCKDIWDIRTCYVTAAPCITCTKLLLNTGCTRIVFDQDYPTSGKALWEASGRLWEKFDDILQREKESNGGNITS